MHYRKLITLLALFLSFSSAHAANAFSSSREIVKMNVDGVDRQYIIHYPKNINTKSEWPVIIAFHPFLSTDAGMEKISKIHQNKKAQDYIVIYPEGKKRRWNVGNLEDEKFNDFNFFDSILKNVKKKINIKPKVYVTGFSNGARFVYHLMCHRPSQIAAAVPFGATQLITNCYNSKPIPFMHLHGELDESSPVEGGYAKGRYWAKKLGYMHPVSVSVDEIVKRNQCSSRTQTVYNKPIKTYCQQYTACQNNTPTKYCIIEGLGHAWPGNAEQDNALSKRFGPYRQDLDGTEAIMNFFNSVK